MWSLFNNNTDAIGYVYTANPVSYKTGIYKIVGNGLRLRSQPNTSSSIHFEMSSGTRLDIVETTASGWGKTTLNGKTGWCALWYCEYVGELISKPNPPSISISPTGDVADGTPITVSWAAVKHTDGYKVYHNGTEVQKSNKTAYTFTASGARKHSVMVRAYNSKYTSGDSSTVYVTSHAPSTVLFQDWNGVSLGVRSNIKYGSPAVAPENPSREGHTFTGWNKAFDNVTEDLVVTATYKINTYQIKFVDNQNRIISTQKVTYGEDAVEPENKNVPTGHVFVGWSSDKYLGVKEDAVIEGIYSWENADLPIVASITSARRQSDGYYVYLDLVNYPDETTRGRAVVSLKTSDGKLIETTESAAFSIPKSGTKSAMEIFIPCYVSASRVEVIIVDSYSSGVPISASVSATVDQAMEWSDWSVEAPPNDAAEIEQRLEYQYRTKSTATSSSSSYSGWTLYNTTFVWSAYGAWSAWQRTAVSPSDSRAVETNPIPAKTKTQYNYSKWCERADGVGRAGPSKGYWSGIWCGNYLEDGWKDTRKTLKSTDQGFNIYVGAWFNERTRQVQTAAPYTEYRYRDRSKIYTYHFYKWSEWSEWSPSYVAESETCEVQPPRTVYRYRYQYADAGIEDTSGTVLEPITGTLNASFAGDKLNLYIYKFDEASDYTNEYVAQTTIGSDGSYSFSGIKLREEPSIATGDMTVAIGIEGTTNTIIIDTIEAPRPTYTVNFYDYNGNLVSAQTVYEGATADLPENPSREGYDFAGWDANLTDIRENIDTNARYVQKKYTVVFVNWTTKEIKTKEFLHGDMLTPPDTEPVEGYNLVGWSDVIGGETTVTENMILTAEYVKDTFEVVFYDYDMNILSTQTVEYGNVAEIPEIPEEEKIIFLGWNAGSGDLHRVTGGLDVYPDYVFEDTCAAPTASVSSGVFTESFTVELSCETEGALIYYSTDGSDPEFGSLYTAPITISRGCELKFLASAFEMNDSAVCSRLYAVNIDNLRSAWMARAEVPSFVFADLAHYSLLSEQGYKYRNTSLVSTIAAAQELEMDGWLYDADSNEYGEWSTPSRELPEANGRFIQEAEPVDPPPESVKYYGYSHWKYYNEATSSYDCAPEEIEGTDGEWERIELPSLLTVTGFVSDAPAYSYQNENWFNQEPIFKEVVPDYKLYSYRVENRCYYKWTDWTVDVPADDDPRETETATVYSYIEPKKYILTVVGGGEFSDDQMLVIAGDKLSLDLTKYARDGYELVGFCTDEALTDEWDVKNDIMTQNVTLYPKYEQLRYTVTFEYPDGTAIDTQTLTYGDEAQAPEVEVEDGYVFLGWSTDDYLYVTQNMTVTASIKLESEIVKVTLNKTRHTATQDSMFRLVATVTPDTVEDKSIEWSSSDYDVADVDQNGTVTALSAGTAEITATTADGTYAVCKLTVLADPESALTLKNTAEYFIDKRAGTLRGVKESANTVSDIRTRFANSSLVFVGPDGNELGADALAGTGTLIRLMDADSVLDEIAVVVTGDLNGDGRVNNRDSATAMRYLVNKETLSACQLTAIDVNGDGYTNNRDAAMIARYLVGKEVF